MPINKRLPWNARINLSCICDQPASTFRKSRHIRRDRIVNLTGRVSKEHEYERCEKKNTVHFDKLRIYQVSARSRSFRSVMNTGESMRFGSPDSLSAFNIGSQLHFIPHRAELGSEVDHRFPADGLYRHIAYRFAVLVECAADRPRHRKLYRR